MARTITFGTIDGAIRKHTDAQLDIKLAVGKTFKMRLILMAAYTILVVERNNLIVVYAKCVACRVARLLFLVFPFPQ